MLIPRKPAKTSDSRERLNGSQVYVGCTTNPGRRRIIALRRSREPPVAAFFSRIERYKRSRKVVGVRAKAAPLQSPFRPYAHSPNHQSLLTPRRRCLVRDHRAIGQTDNPVRTGGYNRAVGRDHQRG
jgi:hypothetical protein